MNDNDFVDPTYAERVRRYEVRHRHAAEAPVIDEVDDNVPDQGGSDLPGIAFGLFVLLLVIAAGVAGR